MCARHIRIVHVAVNTYLMTISIVICNKSIIGFKNYNYVFCKVFVVGFLRN